MDKNLERDSFPPGLSAHDIVQDLRGPLTSLLAAADLLATGKVQGDLPNQVENVRFFAQRLGTTIDDLEDLELLLRGGSDRMEDTFDLHQVLRDCVAESGPQLSPRAVELRADLDPSLPRWVIGDPVRLRQLLTRLIMLAAQHCTIGPIDLTAAADHQHLRLSIVHHDPNCRVDAGISAALCQHLAAFLQGGLVMACRADHSGLSMLLTLPRRDAPAWEIELAEADADQQAGHGPHGAHRLTGSVLLVENEPDHMLLIARLLASLGAQVTTAGTAPIALHLLDNVPFDLILLDMATPGLDSLGAVRELRGRNQATPVLALTTGTSAAELERCLAAGCNGCVPKPIDPTLLSRSLALHMQPAG